MAATTRSYSGVQRSGMISATGVTDRWQATPHRHGPKRGARTSTTPNSEIRRRGRPALERALCPAPVATAPTAAVLIHLRRDEMALYRGQDRLALLQAEAQRRCGMPGWEALARADLVPLRRAVRPGQLQHDPPPHRAPAPQPPAAGIVPPRFWTVSSRTTSTDSTLGTAGRTPGRT